MKKVIFWIIGAALGATAAALLVALFSPINGDDVMRRLKAGYDEAMTEARLASQQRRTELEAQLQAMQKRPVTQNPNPQLSSGKGK